jgi:hypothetical protein
MYMDPPPSVDIVKPARAILWCSRETQMIAVLVEGEKWLPVRSYQLSVPRAVGRALRTGKRGSNASPLYPQKL